MSLHPTDRLGDSRQKIRPPFALDPSMCFYSPQANRDALSHPRVAAWIDFLTHEWQPPKGQGTRVALLIPCTKSKPYATSREHRAINGALLAAGWEPSGTGDAPEELYQALDTGEDRALLHNGPLRKGSMSLDRIVVSEPLGMVPYPFIYSWHGEQSPATSYDDPGLFEGRGTSVSPERADSTAVDAGGGKWRWGPNERAAFVDVHNRLVDVIADTLERVRDRYAAIGAWVSPGLTHRSFLAGAEFRRAEGLPRAKRGPRGPIQLRGVLDRTPGLVTIMPTAAQLAVAKRDLSKRLARTQRSATPGAVRAVYARGDGNDTPLGLPEVLRHLTGWLEEVRTSAR